MSWTGPSCPVWPDMKRSFRGPCPHPRILGLLYLWWVWLMSEMNLFRSELPMELVLGDGPCV